MVTVLDAIKNTVIDDDKAREENRRRHAYDRIRMLNDDYVDLVEARLNKQVSAETSKRLNEFVNIGQNIFKAIMTRLSRIYRNAPVRMFEAPEGGQVADPVLEEIDALYQQAQVDRKMKTVNLYLNAVNEVLIQPVVRDGRLTLDVLTPDMIRVYTDKYDPTKMTELWVAKERWDEKSREVMKYWVVWTETEHYWLIEKEQGRVTAGITQPIYEKQAIDGNEEMVNPYGVIPVVELHRYANEDTFFNETSGSDLYDANLIIACRNTLLDYAATWQSFKQLVMNNVDEAPKPGLTIGPDALMWAQGAASISALDLHANFDAIRGDLEGLVAAVGRNYGISLDSFNAPSQQSGRALVVMNQTLLDSLADQVDIFRAAEVALWELIKIICRVEGLGDYTAELNIRFFDNSHENSKEAFELDQLKMAAGVLSPGEFYQRYNFGVSDEGLAVEKMAENLKAVRELQPPAQGLRIDTMMDDLSAE